MLARKSTRTTTRRFRPILESLGERVLPAVKAWIGGPDEILGQPNPFKNRWSHGPNWAGGVPGPGDIALFTYDRVTHTDANNVTHPGPWNQFAIADGPFTLAGVELDATWSGTVQISNTVNLTGESLWTRGTLTTAAGQRLTLTATAAMVLNNPDAVEFRGPGEIRNQGTITQASASELRIRNGGFLENEGRYRFAGDGDLTASFGNGRFTNRGILEKTGGGGDSDIGATTTTYSLAFENLGGTIDVQTGSLNHVDFNDVSDIHDATIKVAAGSGLNFAKGNAAAAYFQGMISASGAGKATLANGPFVLRGDTTFQFPQGMFEWADSYVDTRGFTLTNAPGSHIKLVNAESIYLESRVSSGGKIRNQGTITHAGAGSLVILHSSEIQNEAGATFDIQTDADLHSTHGNSGSFINRGLLKKSAGSGPSLFGSVASGSSFITNNLGTISVQTGSMVIYDTFTNYDPISDTLTGGTFDITGSLQFVGADVRVNAANLLLDGPTSVIQDPSGADALANFTTNSATGRLTLRNGRNLTVKAQASVLGSFNPSLGLLDAIGFDPVTSNLFVHPDFSTTFHEFTKTGTPVLPAATSPGASSNDFDFDFLDEAIVLGGTSVPSGSLLAVNGDDSPDKLYALDKNNGAVLASVNLPTVDNLAIGVAYHPGRNTIFVLDSTSDQIQEINPATGSQIARFPVRPTGSPSFAVSYGDLEVDPRTGNLLVVGSSQTVLRELTPTGTLVRDFNLAGLGVSSLSGIARDDSTGELYFSTTGGIVARISDFRFRNEGTISVGVGSKLSVDGQRYFQLAGTTEILGTLSVALTEVAGGSLTGIGTLDGDLLNAGTLSPGSSPGVLTVLGDLVNNGTFQMELNGTGTGQHDRIRVNGQVAIGGSLSGTLGFTPELGDVLLLLDGDTKPVHGTFQGLPEESPITFNGHTFYISYLGGDIRLIRNVRSTALVLNGSSILENSSVGTTVGTLTSVDPDVGDSFTYTLATGSGDTDNSLFDLSGNQLRTKTLMNFESKSSYSVRIRSTDRFGLSFEKVFTIQVLNRNEAPLVSIKKYNPTAVTKPIHSIQRNSGFSFRTSAKTDVQVSDPDLGTALGIHRVTVKTSIGKIQLATTARLISVAGNRTSKVIMEGTLAHLNSALNGLTVTPPTGWVGVFSVTFQIVDKGNTGTGTWMSDQKTVYIRTQNLAPRAPLVGMPSRLTYTLSAPSTVLKVAERQGLIRGKKDADGDRLTTRLVIAPPASAGKLSLFANGAFNFTRKLGFQGTTSFVFQYFDGLEKSVRVTVFLRIL